VETVKLSVRQGTIKLQKGIIYGPVMSRRLGRSLGINLLPDEIKVCSLNCAYCQYSWTGMLTADGKEAASFYPSREDVSDALDKIFIKMSEDNTPPDTVTFSGNGEATLHPEFPSIVDDLLEKVDKWFPACRTAALSNSTTLDKRQVFDALLKLDDSIMKLDAGNEAVFRILNRPARGISFDHVVAGLKEMGPRAVLQSMFVNGRVDNTTEENVDAWVEVVSSIKPRSVQVFTLDRGPADPGLRSVPMERLEEIAGRLASAGIEAEAF